MKSWQARRPTQIILQMLPITFHLHGLPPAIFPHNTENAVWECSVGVQGNPKEWQSSQCHPLLFPTASLFHCRLHHLPTCLATARNSNHTSSPKCLTEIIPFFRASPRLFNVVRQYCGAYEHLSHPLHAAVNPKKETPGIVSHPL